MTSTEQIDTEERILRAAQKIFEADGFSGARMQNIADEANINKAMLHYYFRTKELLFEKILTSRIQKLEPSLKVLEKDLDNWENAIHSFVRSYYDFLKENALLFILFESSKRPEILANLKSTKGKSFLLSFCKRLVNEKKTRPMDPRVLVVFILSICQMPFATKPMLKKSAILMKKIGIIL